MVCVELVNMIYLCQRNLFSFLQKKEKGKGPFLMPSWRTIRVYFFDKEQPSTVDFAHRVTDNSAQIKNCRFVQKRRKIPSNEPI